MKHENDSPRRIACNWNGKSERERERVGEREIMSEREVCKVPCPGMLSLV